VNVIGHLGRLGYMKSMFLVMAGLAVLYFVVERGSSPSAPPTSPDTRHNGGSATPTLLETSVLEEEADAGLGRKEADAPTPSNSKLTFESQVVANLLSRELEQLARW
jgi:hypothetical protein